MLCVTTRKQSWLPKTAFSVHDPRMAQGCAHEGRRDGTWWRAADDGHGDGRTGQQDRAGRGGGWGGSSGAPGSSSGNAYIRRGERLTYMCSCAAGPPGIARRVMTIEVGAHLV
jgi:hypothetical protein